MSTGSAIRTLTIIIALLAFVGAALGAGTFIAVSQPHAWKEPTLWVPVGQSRPAIAQSISELSGLPLLLTKATVRLVPNRPLQAGEYDLAGQPSVIGVLRSMQDGRFIKRNVTIPEGLTSYQIIEKLKTSFGVVDDCPPYRSVAEGTLLPETYAYTRGETCMTLLGRMKNMMDQKAAELWANRDPHLPYKDWNEAVTMASIVEKETGVKAERARVAGVFVNRLRVGMPLQSDPTTIYALSNGTADMGRELTRADWKVPHPYNTYTIPALPPGPIAHPGLASLQAALHPEQNDYFFFVADGTGGHAFGKTLDDHISNMKK